MAVHKISDNLWGGDYEAECTKLKKENHEFLERAYEMTYNIEVSSGSTEKKARELAKKVHLQLKRRFDAYFTQPPEFVR